MPRYLPEGQGNRPLFIVLTAVDVASSWCLENAIPRAYRDAENEGSFGVAASEGKIRRPRQGKSNSAWTDRLSALV